MDFRALYSACLELANYLEMTISIIVITSSSSIVTTKKFGLRNLMEINTFKNISNLNGKRQKLKAAVKKISVS